MGWNESHRRFAAALQQEAVDGKTMATLAIQFKEDGPGIIKFFVRHGLLGTAERVPQRHRYYYRQRFAFDEMHGNDDAVSVNKDYFFLHPAFKEWIRSQPEQIDGDFVRLRVGVVGDLEAFESQAPLLRLCLKDGKAFILLRTKRRMSILERGTVSDPLRFLFVLLWARKALKTSRVDVAELKRIWIDLKSIDVFREALNFYLPHQLDELAAKLRDWQKKINADDDIRELKRAAAPVSSVKKRNGVASKMGAKTNEPFLSISATSKLGAQIEMWFPNLSLEDFDAEDSMLAVIGLRARQ